MDLSGFGEFCYALEGSLEENLRRLEENDRKTVSFITA